MDRHHKEAWQKFIEDYIQVNFAIAIFRDYNRGSFVIPYLFIFVYLFPFCLYHS